MTDAQYDKLLATANDAALEAGQEWMDKMTARGPKYIVNGNPDWGMLDLCGNAHVQAYDGRTKFAKYLKRLDPRGNGGAYCNITVPILNKFRCRQEYGLQQAMANAVLKVLTDAGIKKLRIWEYVD